MLAQAGGQDQRGAGADRRGAGAGQAGSRVERGAAPARAGRGRCCAGGWSAGMRSTVRRRSAVRSGRRAGSTCLRSRATSRTCWRTVTLLFREPPPGEHFLSGAHGEPPRRAAGGAAAACLGDPGGLSARGGLAGCGAGAGGGDHGALAAPPATAPRAPRGALLPEQSARPPRRRSCSRWSGSTGTLRTGCTGRATSPSAKMPARCARAVPRRRSPPCAMPWWACSISRGWATWRRPCAPTPGPAPPRCSLSLV